MTDTPEAATPRTGLRARRRMMSRSWIIMSSTTPTSMDRNVSGLIRTTSINRGDIALFPSLSPLIARTAGLKRSICPTCSGASWAAANSTMRRASAESRARGFSIRQAMPRVRNRPAASAWVVVGVAMVTARAVDARSSIETATVPYSSATAAATSAS